MKTEELDITVSKSSSRDVTISWYLPEDVNIHRFWLVLVKDDEVDHCFGLKKDSDSLDFEDLEPGCTYTAVLDGILYVGRGRKRMITCSGSAKFTTVLTKAEQRELLSRAEDHRQYLTEGRPLFLECQWVTRDKDPGYFHNARKHCGNKMIKTLKDMNGDPASLINGRVKGIFFHVNMDVDTHDTPVRSNYGSMRFQIPADLFLSDSLNMYFADFYCMYTAHYVTLVLCREGSWADKFCSSNLLELDLDNNEFLYKSQGSVYVSTAVWVEVFYTEDVSIAYWLKHGGRIHRSVARSNYATPHGIRKNEHCTICNLHPK